MYIAPDSKLYFLHGVPLDKTYEHTLYFNTEAAQKAYFESQALYKLTNQSYQRLQKGVMRVELKAEALFACNYVMFQNTAFGDKWFYAFISGVEYVNNVTSDVTFEIDVMQTWFFNYQLEECFVEREHAANDIVGANTVPENLELGPYLDHIWGSRVVTGYTIVVAATFDANFEDIGGLEYAGIFSGCMYHTFDETEACAEFLKQVATKKKQDGVISVFLMAKDFVRDPGRPMQTGAVEVPRPTMHIASGYQPRNKKLLTWPYMYLYVTDMQGKGAEYRYELFEGDTCDFTTAGDMSCNPMIVMIPMRYKATPANYSEMITLQGFPQLVYNVDTYRGWLAQSVGSLSVNALAAATISTVFPATAPIALGTLAGQVASTVSQVYPQSLQPPQAKGSGGATGYAAMGILDFVLAHRTITREYAEIIDDYFDAYGYATHRLKIPNRNVRPHWCYTKTIGCNATGSMPADDIRKVCEIYNNGITFWKDPKEVGDYTLDNSV